MSRDIINPSIQPLKGLHAEMGERFRKSRLRLELTLRDAATVLDMTPTRLSEIERGDIYPTTLEVWKLLDYATMELGVANQTIKEKDGAK